MSGLLGTCPSYGGGVGGVGLTISRLRDLTRNGDHTYYADIVLMAGLPLGNGSPARWLDTEQTTRRGWRALVTARRLAPEHRAVTRLFRG